MQEFIYYNPNGLDFPLNEEILVTNNIEDVKEQDFLISNTSDVNAEVNADEIDFYLKNTKDPVATQIENIYKLYEIAANKYDLAQDISYSQEVSKQLLLITNSQDSYNDFLACIKPEDFELFFIKEEMVKSISGMIGNLNVVVDDEGKDVDLNVSQIVWFDAKKEGMKQSGCFDPLESSIEEVVSQLKENINEYSYKKFTTYDSSICQYHERREEICSKCEEVCPTVAITKDDKTKTLGFSQIDCHGCGGCISVCPSGAMDYAPSNRNSIYEMSKFYKNTHPLVIPEKMNMKDLSADLKENVLPFSIEGEKFLDESTFLTLLQLSGSQVIFYSDFISKGSGDAIRIVNDIYQKKYGKDAIIVAMDEKELEEALKIVSFVENTYFNFNQDDLRKREVFSHRLQKIVGDEDLGQVQTGEHVHYGQVKVNEDTCTLCLVCVGACNVDALQADASDNTLRLNPSLCTACGYCEVSCPEADCLTIEKDVINLQPAWFKESVLAQDELFPCVECGVEFATKKSVEKIAKMMAPIFSADPVKERSLYCCADCKPKIMMQNYYDQKNQGMTNAR